MFAYCDILLTRKFVILILNHPLYILYLFEYQYIIFIQWALNIKYFHHEKDGIKAKRGSDSRTDNYFLQVQY